jgi:hypothetical protein
MIYDELVALRAERSVPKPKKTKKTEDSAEPKEKKPPSAWIVFSSQRVGPLIRTLQEGLDKSEKSKVGTINQFAGTLWAQKKEWSDAEITSAWPDFTPPEVSKQAEKRSSSSVGSADAAEPVADVKKARKPQSAETKAAAAAKRAATKAAKLIDDEPLGSVAPAPKKKIAAKPKKVDLALDTWEHDGVEYLKNERGDVVDEGGEWVGRWNGTIIDKSVPEPADCEQLTTRD